MLWHRRQQQALCVWDCHLACPRSALPSVCVERAAASQRSEGAARSQLPRSGRVEPALAAAPARLCLRRGASVCLCVCCCYTFKATSERTLGTLDLRTKRDSPANCSPVLLASRERNAFIINIIILILTTNLIMIIGLATDASPLTATLLNN